MPYDLIPVIFIPAHQVIYQGRESFPCDLPALSLIWFCYAPAHRILIVFPALAYCENLFLLVKHEIDINGILKPIYTGNIKGGAVLSDCDRRLSYICKEFLPQHMITVIRKTLFNFRRFRIFWL